MSAASLNGSVFSRPSRTAGDRTSPTHALVSAKPAALAGDAVHARAHHRLRSLRPAGRVPPGQRRRRVGAPDARRRIREPIRRRTSHARGICDQAGERAQTGCRSCERDRHRHRRRARAPCRAARRDRHHCHHAVLLDAAGRNGARTFHPGRIGGDDPVFSLQRSRRDAGRQGECGALSQTHRAAAQFRRRDRSKPGLAVHDRTDDGRPAHAARLPAAGGNRADGVGLCHRGNRHVGPPRRHCTAARARALRPVPRPETVRGPKSARTDRGVAPGAQAGRGCKPAPTRSSRSSIASCASRVTTRCRRRRPTRRTASRTTAR